MGQNDQPKGYMYIVYIVYFYYITHFCIRTFQNRPKT